MNPLKVLFITAEAAPFAKTGGLADVSSALPQALTALGHDVRVVLPLYPRVREQAKDLVPEGVAPIWIEAGRAHFECAIARATFPGSALPVWFVHCPPLFDRPSIYTSDADEHVRFSVLTRAAIELAQRWQWAPDVVHAHDWHTALAPLYLKTAYAWDRLFEHTTSLYTIHNLGHQGVFGSGAITDLGLGDAARFLNQDDVRDGRVNFMKTGIAYAHMVSTVSPTYAREIQTEAYGFGLHDLLRARAGSLVGILNGIDEKAWNPRTDPHLAAHYSAKSLYRKDKNKQALLASLGLSYERDVPVLGIVTRLSPQKGIELLKEPLPRLLAERDLRFVALASGDPRDEEFLRALQQAFPGKVCYWQGFNDKLAHLIEAGSDVFLMPSLYEPCGLNQMYSQRYGTVPVVRRTGGLADTVEQWDPRTGRGTGFLFDHGVPSGLDWALRTALDTYRDKKAWTTIMKNGMAREFGWSVEAPKYVALYDAMRRHSRGGTPAAAQAGRP
jgi:starch synthase